jgi:hypothetical protein
LREGVLRRCQAVGVEAKKLKAANTQLKDEIGTDFYMVRARMLKRCAEFLQEHMMGMARLPKREEIENYKPPEEEEEVRCAFSDRNLHSRMPLSFTPLLLLKPLSYRCT